MKKLYFVLFTLFILAPVLRSQTVNEKPIVKFSEHETVDPYSFRYDAASGTYIYAPYDTVTKTSTIFSNKGNSAAYGSVNSYSAIFDKDGNYYAGAYNNFTDTTFVYFFLKNGQSVASFNWIDDGWVERDGVIYFSAKDKDMSYFVSYKISDGTVSKSKAYDDIKLVYFKEVPSEGEPVREVGFTKDGKTYYMAESNDEKFIVIGGDEQKHYSDIDPYYTTTDVNGALTHIAKGNGKFYETKGDAFVVQGSMEYKKFDYIYGPILFDKNNNPVYIAADSTVGSENPQRVMVGNVQGKTYSSGIYGITFTPSGKPAYVGSMFEKKNKTRSMVAIDEKEGKKYSAVYSLSFGPNDEPIFAASKDGKNYFLVAGKTEYDNEYEGILDPKVLPDGKLYYIGINYGNWEKKIRDKYFVHIGENTFGPYDGLQTLDYRTGSYILADKSGAYAYVVSNTKKFDPYTSTQNVLTNRGKSGEFDYFENVNLYNGNIIFTTSTLADAGGYTYKNKIYYWTKDGVKQLGTDYDAVMDYNFNPNGTVTFSTFKNQAYWWVEIKL